MIACGATLARGRTHADATLGVAHTGPGGVSRELYTSVVDDEAVSVPEGSTILAACNAAGRLALGINMTISCLQPASGGVLHAEAVEAARSRKTATCTVRVTDDRQRLVALFQGTAYIKNTSFPEP